MNEIWDSIYEQENVKEILIQIYKSRRVPHAFLFYGTDGVGKFYTALQFAKQLYSDHNSSRNELVIKKISLLQEPYVKLITSLPRGRGETGEDSSFEKLSKEQLEIIKEEIYKKSVNPYYKIQIENANTIKINSIRDVKKFLDMSFDEIPYRFVFILDAEMMNDQAQNALLKSLEEPPEGIIFFLITSNKEKLLQTIQSRCWAINFEPLSNNSIAQVLINNFQIADNIAENAAYFSNGSINQGLFLANNEFAGILDKTVSFLRFAIGKRYHSAYQELIEIMQNQSEEEFRLMINLIKNWLSDVLRVRFSYNEFYYENYKDTFTKFNQRYNKSNVQKVITNLEFLETSYNKNLNLNVLILNLIFELATLPSRN